MRKARRTTAAIERPTSAPILERRGESDSICKDKTIEKKIAITFLNKISVILTLWLD